jgi:exo-beta-1,3-glucanase (GH17 family)
MKLFAGVWDVSDVSSEVQLIIDAAKNNWDAIDTISIGNECINSGTATVDQVVSGVNTARSLLKAAGYNGKVVTVDTFNQIIANPQLCQVSDFAAANCHAFFDSSISADQAGSYVKEQAQRVQQACGGKDTVITESGWPSNGDTNGAAVPSEANQQKAISSLRSAFSSNLVLFSAFNDDWKQNFDGSFNAEHYWGIYGNAPA